MHIYRECSNSGPIFDSVPLTLPITHITNSKDARTQQAILDENEYYEAFEDILYVIFNLKKV